MTGQTNFDCHDFFDNTNLCLLEISYAERGNSYKRFQWLLIHKKELSVKEMHLRNSDGSASVQERFFDLGFLKYQGDTGVFIEAQAKDLHHLERKDCGHIPHAYLLAVQTFLDQQR